MLPATRRSRLSRESVSRQGNNLGSNPDALNVTKLMARDARNRYRTAAKA